ncbi:hypothetical protein Zmor_009766 [Zophobas morio]|uniref:Uncharacterized protein n=1 Tax=Zophobas morio TaxID=2755281 RepID=A0AA38MJ63_9CUCU|nr:hypothetical protein Zmor_009766 [Zophobas morio]
MLAVLTCSKNWKKPLLCPLTSKEEQLHYVSNTFLPIPGIQVYDIIPQEKKNDREPCGWVVKCRHTFDPKNYEKIGLYNYTYGLVKEQEPRNTTNLELVMLGANEFKVTYTLVCGC